MCGITGLLSTSVSSLDARNIVARSMHALSRRGPDGQGLFQDGPCTLGHTRLAVIDTSAAGTQPLSHSGVTLVFNGELYNFLDERVLLEKEGVTFTGHSDAEVLLRMYIFYGENFLERLRGMYAFAIWDARSQTLLCARDPLGIKPFLYTLHSKVFLFSSEIKGILATGLTSRTVNPSALFALLMRGSVPQQTHILDGVCWLKPGNVLTIKPGESPSIRKFCSITPSERHLNLPWPELLAETKIQILKALRRQLVADVPLGAFLSGGIDSSLLVALMNEERGGVCSFSVGFESGLLQGPDDETADAALVADYLKINHRTIIVTQQDVLDSLPSIAAALDHPSVDGVNSFFVARAARQELTVAISGTGGDEIFAGYPWFSTMQNWSRASFWTRQKRRWGWGGTKECFKSYFDKQYEIFPEFNAALIMAKHWRQEALIPPVREDPFPDSEALNRVTGLVLAGYTRDQLLADIDAAASWHGLEVRVPFLDEDLLRFALSLPPAAKIGPCNDSAPQGSYAHSGIKRALVEIGASLLPPDFAFRAKRGFTLPFDGWLHGRLSPVMLELLSPETVRSRGFFAPGAVQDVLQEYMAGHTSWVYPWLLMMTELWAQEVLDG